MNKIFFKGLNELRAVAAFAVVFHHIELFKYRDGVGSLFNTNFRYFIEHLGKNAVYLFFVLSGFLITYLLINEKESNKKINLIKFYLRRVFRIWPLYYFILLISFFLIPYLAHNFEIFQSITSYYDRINNEANFSMNAVLLYSLFLPNLAILYNYIVVGCSQVWSVGVEEQFYVIWPLLIILFNKKVVLYIFILFLILMSLVSIFYFKDVFPFEYMAIGAIGGYLLYYYLDFFKKIIKDSAIFYFLIIGGVLVLSVLPFISVYFQSLIVSFLFILLIIFSVISESKVVLINKSLSFLGQISYGIYMYHPLVMFLVFPFANKYFKNNIVPYNVFVYTFIPIITIVLSYLSYKFIELKFIKFKDSKFSTI